MLSTVNYAKSRLESGKGVMTNIYPTTNIEKVAVWKRPVIMNFIDFKKRLTAFTDHHSGGF